MAHSTDADLFMKIIESAMDSKEWGSQELTELPSYAEFLLAEKVPALAGAQYRLSMEWRLPMLQYFSHLSEEQLLERGSEGIRRLLTAIRDKDIDNYIRTSVRRWIADQLREISRNDIAPADIALISQIWRKLFRDFLPDYTPVASKWLQIMEEVDWFLTRLESSLYKTVFTLQQQLSEQGQQIAHLGTWMWDLGANTLAWSNELYRIYEFPPQSPIPVDLAAFNHPADAPMVLEEMRISRETKQPHDFYYRILLPSGREKHLHARGQVLLDEKGEVNKLFGTLQDVTVQKQIEKAHSENENFIQKITDLTPSLIAVYNILTGEYLFLNQAFTTLLGYPVEEARKRGVEFFISLVHPDDIQRLLTENAAAIQEMNVPPEAGVAEQIREFTYRLRHNNGEYRWFHTYGTVFERDEQYRIVKVINISNDITEQIVNRSLLRQQMEKIELSEDRYYKMVDEVEEYAILLLTRDGLIENWNKGAEKIKGYAAAEIIGRHLRVFYTSEDREAGTPEKLLGQAADSGKATQEGWRVRKDGSRFWAYVAITALYDKEGGLIGFSKVTRDLSDRKMADENLRYYARALESKNSELLDKNKELESFAYIASHDLQEPLRKIRIWSDRLEKSESLSEKGRSGMAKINKAGSRMQALIEGLLQYSRMGSGADDRESTDLNILLEEVLADFSELLEERKVVVEKTALPTISLVRLQIQQLFSNLISNAIKYAKKEVSLQLRISCTFIEDTGFGRQSYYQLSFSDNGIGFEQEYAGKIFDLFQRLGNSDNSGTGLGLAICRKIVQNHGGSIRAFSEAGVGTTFVVRLPIPAVI